MLERRGLQPFQQRREITEVPSGAFAGIPPGSRGDPWIPGLEVQPERSGRAVPLELEAQSPRDIGRQAAESASGPLPFERRRHRAQQQGVHGP